MGGISLGRVTVLLVGGRAVGYVLALANSVVIARLLGPERLGAYGYAMGLAGLFALLPNMGISTVVTRAVARGEAEGAAVLGPALRAQGLLAAVALAAVVGLAAALPASPATLGQAALAGAQLAVGTLSWPYLALLSGHARWDRVAAVELGSAVVGTACVVVAALVDGTVTAFLWGHVVGATGALVTARLVAAPFVVPAPDALSLGSLFRQATPFGAAAAAQSLYTRLDIVLLGQLAPALAVGLYSAAYKPINFAVYFGGTVAGVLFPLVARTPTEAPPVGFHRAFRALALTGPAVALVLTGLAGPLLVLLYGAGFAAGAGALAVLAWSVVANWLYAPLGVALQARGGERGWLACLCAGLIVNATVNLLAIPRWGAVGAALATLTSEVALLLGAAALLGRGVGSLAWLRPLAVPAGAAALAGLVLAGLEPEVGGGPATLVALVAYAALLVVGRSVSAEDVRLVVGWVREALRG